MSNTNDHFEYVVTGSITLNGINHVYSAEYDGDTKSKIIHDLYIGQLFDGRDDDGPWYLDPNARVLEINITDMTVEDITADVIGEVELLVSAEIIRQEDDRANSITEDEMRQMWGTV